MAGPSGASSTKRCVGPLTQFGDGIMSAIDFRGHVEKVEDPKGDRVKITLDGKFLPYRRW